MSEILRIYLQIGSILEPSPDMNRLCVVSVVITNSFGRLGNGLVKIDSSNK